MITDFYNSKATEGYNKGGVCSFKFAPCSDIDALPRVADAQYLGTVTFKSGKTWLNGYAAYDTLDFDENPKGAGLYQPVLRGLSLVDEPNNLALFERMQSERFIILVKDRHGREVIAGTLKRGLKFTFKRTKGKRTNNNHGIEFEFGGRIYPWPAYYY